MDRLVKPGRMLLLTLLLILLIGVYVVALYKLQIVEGAAYYEQSQNSIVTESSVTAARGNILDRYGRVLVSNRSCNNLVINTDELFSDDVEDPNAVILEIVRIIESTGDTYNDELPITMEAPFEFVEDMTAVQSTLLDAYAENIRSVYDADFPDDPTAVDFMAFFRSRYDIDDSYTAEETRIIAGIRYALNVRYIIATSDYIFAEDVSIDLITQLMESDLPGITVEVSYIREYETIYAAHVLGYVGAMNPDQVETYTAQGYSLDAQVGQEGAELAFEEYLHGSDGEVQITSTSSGTVTGTTYLTEPEPGNHVYLTIDIGLQEAAEQALASYIQEENALREEENAQAEAYGGETTQLITGGAVVAVDVNSGEPLAIASYPTYDLSSLLDNYSEISTAENEPLFNRATMGTYAPGSTFKPCTAIAALDQGIITTDTTIYDAVTFDKYADQGYAPSCWILGQGTHGDVNVTSAITESCNYFFYTVGDYLTIERLYPYAVRFGLGQSTGIELPEYLGTVASPEYKEEAVGEEWYLGDTLQAAIGQSYNLFTPLQLAEYTAALANGGTRYSASILKSVRSYDYSEEIYEREAEVLSTVETEEEYYEAVQLGMYGVANNVTGSVYSVFGNYAYCEVAAKTGTAQTGANQTNNGVFICYAPYDDPEIAVVVVVEKGSAGSALASIARDVLDYYFSFKTNANSLEGELELLQ